MRGMLNEEENKSPSMNNNVKRIKRRRDLDAAGEVVAPDVALLLGVEGAKHGLYTAAALAAAASTVARVFTGARPLLGRRHRVEPIWSRVPRTHGGG